MTLELNPRRGRGCQSVRNSGVQVVPDLTQRDAESRERAAEERQGWSLESPELGHLSCGPPRARSVKGVIQSSRRRLEFVPPIRS